VLDAAGGKGAEEYPLRPHKSMPKARYFNPDAVYAWALRYRWPGRCPCDALPCSCGRLSLPMHVLSCCFLS